MTKKVLIVDDDLNVVAVLREFFAEGSQSCSDGCLS